mmetsp:Transcript_58901/g.144064  ORF Transcript_58901/g.144064 Transcript_58901/m.144064 type:complete len:201 (+) Transcript_58901:911-1513(+)
MDGTTLDGLGPAGRVQVVCEFVETELSTTDPVTGPHRICLDGRTYWECHLGRVPDRDSVLVPRWRRDDGPERTDVSVLKVHTDPLGGVVRSTPQVNVGVERTAFRPHMDLYTLDALTVERPCSETVSLDLHGTEVVPDLVVGTLNGRRDLCELVVPLLTSLQGLSYPLDHPTRTLPCERCVVVHPVRVRPRRTFGPYCPR